MRSSLWREKPPVSGAPDAPQNPTFLNSGQCHSLAGGVCTDERTGKSVSFAEMAVAAYHGREEPKTSHLRPQRVGWASQYYGLAA